MSKRWLGVLAVVAVLCACTPRAMADRQDHENHGNHGDHGRKHQHGNKHSEDDGDRGWERRDGYQYRTYGDRDARPPGWNRGRKTGWGDCGLPPGQAKKYGCRTYTYQGRPHYYYQDDLGRIIIRRPSIEVFGGIVIR